MLLADKHRFNLNTKGQQGRRRNIFKYLEATTPFPLMKPETSRSLQLVYLARQILARINSLTLLIELKVQIPATSTHSWRSQPQDSARPPLQSLWPNALMMWRGFQALAWVRGALKVHVTPGLQQAQWVTTRITASGASSWTSTKTRLPNLDLSSVFPLSAKWHC